MIVFVVVLAMLIFLLGYRFYGRFLGRHLELDDSRPTPACQINDGIDYVPAKPSLLLGQHFSAIAAAGPIVGPILAGIWFGWLPAILWIVLGAIFIGGVHDFSSLIASVRHKAASVGELVKQYMSPTSHVLFLLFVWLALIYVIIAFTDITAQTFKAVTQDTAFGPGVAITSMIYLMLGILMGILLYKFKLNLTVATAIFLPLVLFFVWLGHRFPDPIISFMSNISVKEWDVVLLIYCFFASLVPMWLLLQPRGYLGGLAFVSYYYHRANWGFIRWIPYSIPCNKHRWTKESGQWQSDLSHPIHHHCLRRLFRISWNSKFWNNFKAIISGIGCPSGWLWGHAS